MKSFVFWLKNRLFRAKAMRQYKDVVANSKLSIEELNKLNWEKRKSIVKYAYEHIKFYKEYYDSMSFNPQMLKVEEDWEKVPCVEKSMIRDKNANFVNPFLPRKYFGHTITGGSTGTPLELYTDKRFCIEVLGWRAFNWWNVSPAANIGIIHRRVPTTFKGKIKNRLLWWPTYRAYLNVNTPLEQFEINEFVNKIIKHKIVWLQGYVGGLECVADYVLKNNIKIDSLKLVWSTSAPLNPILRQKMELAFGCKIMNQYGSCEVANIAMQCPSSTNLHINYDYVHVDVVDENNKLLIDCEGDILVTNLYSHTFPLIKYRLGDRGTLLSQKCNCGVSLPMMKEVKGRITDSVFAPDGTWISGEFLEANVEDYFEEIIDRYQIYQKLDYSIVIYLKPRLLSKEILEKRVEQLKVHISNCICHKMPISIELVEKINDDRGKVRLLISEIALMKK